jgi:hypothetical protein
MDYANALDAGGGLYMHRISGWWCLLQVVKRFYLDALEAARARRRRDRIEADVAYWPFSDLTRCPSCVRNTDHNGLGTMTSVQG